jgi:hypothetical protein
VQVPAKGQTWPRQSFLGERVWLAQSGRLSLTVE